MQKELLTSWALSLALALLVVLGAYLILVNANKRVGLVLTPAPSGQNLDTEGSCSKASTCIIGINTFSCCSCPELVNQEMIGENGWERYEKGKDYSSERPLKCKDVVCAPCPPTK